jgi:hypothetical protein
VVGVEGDGTLSPLERPGEVVTAEGEGAESDQGVEVFFVAIECAFEEFFRFRIVAGIADLADFLEVGQTEERGSFAVVRVGAQGVLKADDLVVELGREPDRSPDELVGGRRCRGIGVPEPVVGATDDRADVERPGQEHDGRDHRQREPSELHVPHRASPEWEPVADSR